MPPQITQQRSLKHKIIALSKTAQLYWFLGHVSAIVFFVLSLIFRFISRTKERQFFKLCITSELISYACVLKQLPSGSFKQAQILRNESFQYFAFALVIFLTSFKVNPWTMGLTSFIIYSFFHAITYFQANFLDLCPFSLQTKANVNERITFIASNYNEQALYFASFSEISLLQNLLWEVPRMLFYLWKDPFYVLLDLVNYAALVVFLKLRHDDSKYSKAAVDLLDQKISSALSNPMVPPKMSSFYNDLFKTRVKQVAGYIEIPKTKTVKKNQ